MVDAGAIDLGEIADRRIAALDQPGADAGDAGKQKTSARRKASAA